MLSLVLPLVAIAIALTPVVASASAAYKREIEEQSCRFDGVETNRFDGVETNSLSSIGKVELHH